MSTTKTSIAFGCVALGLFAVGCATPQNAASSPAAGAASARVVANDEVVERISKARCDQSQSCNRIGPGTRYRDLGDCTSRMRALVSGQLSASRCPGAIGEIGVSRCVRSLEASECDLPGQLYARRPRPLSVSNCDLDSMCVNGSLPIGDTGRGVAPSP